MSISSKSAMLMPSPFSWVEIPAGKATLLRDKGWEQFEMPTGETQTFALPAFSIARYPVTNAQYAKFLEAGGYEEKRWWTDLGWEARTQGLTWDASASFWKPSDKAWSQPEFWLDSRWSGLDYPVVGVSWYEAMAFCHWLTEVSGETISLPTEQQWQRAAQGDDERMYPWGNDWDANRCNHSVGRDPEKNSTSPVTSYEGKGDTPFGVVDMTGNVYEWCSSVYEIIDIGLADSTLYALRGGNYRTQMAVEMRLNWRNGGPSVSSGKGAGFRIVRLKAASE